MELVSEQVGVQHSGLWDGDMAANWEVEVNG